MRQGLLKDLDIDHGVVLGELFMLRIALAAWAMQTFFRREVQDRLRLAFNRQIERMLLESDDEEIRAAPNTVIDEINRRYESYIEAIGKAHHHGPAWNVGKVFAQLCRREDDFTVIWYGVLQFGRVLVAIREFLNGADPERLVILDFDTVGE